MATHINRLPANGVHVENAGRSLPSIKKLARRALAFVVDHQRRRAEKLLQPALARFSDADLSGLGFTPAEIARIRGRSAR